MKELREAIYRDHSQVLGIDAILHCGRTQFQEVLVFENHTFGRVLALDGVVQLTRLDNHIYHELIAHVPLTAAPLTAHRNAEDVLIIGGGDGGTLREVLKHPIRRAVLAELDRDVIELSRRYFPEVSNGAFDDPRTDLVIGDAATLVATTAETFDVIIIDSTDPVGPGETLFSDTFYRHCRRLLRPGGLVALQGGIPIFRAAQMVELRNRLAGCFGAARPFLAPVPTYAFGMLALFVAGEADQTLCPPIELLRQRYAAINGGTRFYTPDVHRAAFVMVPCFDGKPQGAG